MTQEKTLIKLLRLVENLGVESSVNAQEGSIKLYKSPQDSNITQKNKKGSYSPGYFEISVDEVGFIFMQIDDYLWEFDDNLNKAMVEIEKYVRAFREGRLVRRTTRIGPVVLGSKLETE